MGSGPRNRQQAVEGCQQARSTPVLKPTWWPSPFDQLGILAVRNVLYRVFLQSSALEVAATRLGMRLRIVPPSHAISLPVRFSAQ